MALHQIIMDFGDSEVRKKSQSTLPAFFREWPSVDAEASLHPTDWKKLRRRVNVLGYPKLDIFAEWIMDFASISAHQLGRSDWKNFRRLILIHVPACPMFCWYCFNDAWPTSVDPNGIAPRPGAAKVGDVTASQLVEAFERYRTSVQAADGNQVNVLRLSGGEPFTQPDLVTDLATAFHAEYRHGNSAFLWVDTNLSLIGCEPGRHDEALRALATLGKQTAVHACLHGADDASLERNTHCRIPFDHLKSGLSCLAHSGIEVYPRINPLGLCPEEAETIFATMLAIREDLPARTYLGPIELHYESSVDRMRAFQGQPSVYDRDAKSLPPNSPGLPAAYHPANAVIYTWNRLMEATYGVGYGVVPRHLAPSLKRLVAPSDRRNGKRWQEVILITKGWEKEAYAEKLLELLALPPGALIEVEYENKWVEPTFVAHLHAAPDYYKEKDILFVAALPARNKLPAKIIPLRWGKIHSTGCDAIDERQSVVANIAVGRYATDFALRLMGKEKEPIWDKLAQYVGESNLPFGSPQGYFCHFVGLELSDDSANETDGAFKTIVLSLTDAPYTKAKRDVYYRIRDIRLAGGRAVQDSHSRDTKEPAGNVTFDQGVLCVWENDEILVSVESCNPSLGNEGYPSFSQTAITVSSTHPENVVIAPTEIKLSKYGSTEVRVRFPRRGDFDGLLILKPKDAEPRIAELRLPFRVQIRS